jgi:hypothetical protein
MADENGYWTYREWLQHTVGKIAVAGSRVSDLEDREAYLRVQIEAAILKSLSHGRSGRSDDEPVIED